MFRRHSATAAGDVPPAVPTPENARHAETLEARAAALLEAGTPVALLTALAGPDAGMAPCRALLAGSALEGTLGDPELDAQALAAALPLLEQRSSARLSLPGADILCEVLSPAQAEAFALAAEALGNGARGAWVVELRQGPAASPQGIAFRRRLYVERQAGTGQASLPPDVFAGLEPALPLLRECGQRPGLVEAGGEGCYVEPLDAPPVLLLCGAGPVAREVANLACACGFVVDVACDAQDATIPQARRMLPLPGLEGLVAACGIGRRHFVAIMTGDAALDRRALQQALTSHAQYIGLTGKREERDSMFNELRSAGVPATELAAVRCPMGLNIGAATPRQHAVAVVAELLAARAGTLTRLRFDS